MLEEEHEEKRKTFCSWAIGQLDRDEDFSKNIIFSDESIFHVNGMFNRHNCHYWSKENPRISLDIKKQWGDTVMVWGGIWGDKVIGPEFFPGNVTGESFLELINDKVMTKINRDLNFKKAIFQLDGAPGHWALKVRDYLNFHFDGSWIGRGGGENGMHEWPPYSPDLNPLDTFLWGYIKDKVYDPKDWPKNKDHLIQKIKISFQSITPEMLMIVRANWELRLWYCLANDGKQFEQLI